MLFFLQLFLVFAHQPHHFPFPSHIMLSSLYFTLFSSYTYRRINWAFFRVIPRSLPSFPANCSTDSRLQLIIIIHLSSVFVLHLRSAQLPSLGRLWAFLVGTAATPFTPWPLKLLRVHSAAVAASSAGAFLLPRPLEAGATAATT